MNRAHIASPPAPSWIRRVLVGGVGLVVTIAAVVLMEFLFGQVAGSEFAPDQFQRRSFFFFQIPWVQLQISPVIRDDVTNELEDHLRRQKLIAARPVSGRWDVVSVRAGAAPTDGQALILCRYLDQQDDQRQLRWLEWTRKHPDLATKFWPAVQQAAMLEAYCLVPELFDLAASSEEPVHLTRQLDRLLATSYAALGDDYLDSGRPAAATSYYAAALKRDPDSLSLRQRQAEAQRQLATDGTIQ